MARQGYGRGTGRNKRDGEMGKLERRFLDEVVLKSPDSFSWWRYEGVTLRLAKGSSYTPDFALMRAHDGVIVLVEVKGFWTEPSRTKVKVAGEMFPFELFGVMWDRKAKRWTWEKFS